MSYRPRCTLRDCPACGRQPYIVRSRFLIFGRVRMECECGVAGQWSKFNDDLDRDAASGWTRAFGPPKTPRPPPPTGWRPKRPPQPGLIERV